jgi:hypothetical protein
MSTAQHSEYAHVVSYTFQGSKIISPHPSFWKIIKIERKNEPNINTKKYFSNLFYPVYYRAINKVLNGLNAISKLSDPPPTVIRVILSPMFTFLLTDDIPKVPREF